MEPVVLDPSVTENGLAAVLAGLMGENVAAHPAKRRDLRAIRTSFAIVAPDAEVAVTLQFRHGGCTLFDGNRPDAEVVVIADSDKIPALSLVEIRYGLPWLLGEAGQGVVRSLLAREIKIMGLVDLPIPHPRATLQRALDLLRLLRVLSVN